MVWFSAPMKSMTTARMTTINPFPREIGARAAELILEVLDGRQPDRATIAIRPELLARQSSR